MIFDYEDEGGERTATRQALSLNEPTHLPSKPPRTRPTIPGLPASLSSLRPSSLPAPPSTLRRQEIVSNPEIDAMEPVIDLPNDPTNQVNTGKDEATSDDEDIHEAEIRKLVAADTPSHRGAWKKDSKAWKTFVRRQGRKERTGGLILEENIQGDTYADSDSDDVQGRKYYQHVSDIY